MPVSFNEIITKLSKDPTQKLTDIEGAYTSSTLSKDNINLPALKGTLVYDILSGIIAKRSMQDISQKLDLQLTDDELKLLNLAKAWEEDVGNEANTDFIIQLFRLKSIPGTKDLCEKIVNKAISDSVNYSVDLNSNKLYTEIEFYKELSDRGDSVEKLINIFLRAPAEINSDNFKGTFHLTQYFEQQKEITLESLKFLIDNGADVNRKGPNGDRPLHALLKLENKASPELIKYLIDNGADVNAKNEVGNSPLHLACLKNKQFIKLLIDKGADINATNVSEQPPQLSDEYKRYGAHINDIKTRVLENKSPSFNQQLRFQHYPEVYKDINPNIKEQLSNPNIIVKAFATLGVHEINLFSVIKFTSLIILSSAALYSAIPSLIAMIPIITPQLTPSMLAFGSTVLSNVTGALIIYASQSLHDAVIKNVDSVGNAIFGSTDIQKSTELGKL